MEIVPNRATNHSVFSGGITPAYSVKLIELDPLVISANVVSHNH